MPITLRSGHEAMILTSILLGSFIVLFAALAVFPMLATETGERL